MTTAYLGIDVAKKDFVLATSQKSIRVLANTNEGFQTLIELLAKYDQPHVVLEASGGYERVLTDALHDAGITVSVVQPGCVRHFAKSLKVLAKTDAIDATVIARFGEATHPAPSEKTPPATRRLRALADRRTQLVEDRVREKNRLETCPDKLITTEINRHIKQLTTLIKKLDEQVKNLIAEEADLAAKSTALQTATGVGTQTAAVLLAHFPELGTLNRHATAALAGLAPHPQESGAWTGKRRIYGGRAVVRKALYMAAKSAARHCPHLAPFYKRLREEGKKAYNVAIIAVARKLLIRLNTLLKSLKTRYPLCSSGHDPLWFGLSQLLVRGRFESHSLLEEAIKQHAAGFGSAAVKAEGELVQVVRQVFGRDGTLVCAEQPAFQERGDQMHSGQQLVGSLRVVPLNHALVREASLFQRSIARPAVGAERTAGSDTVRHKPAQGLGGSVGDHSHANAAQRPTAFLHSDDDQTLLLGTTPVTLFRATHKGFIDLH